MLATITLNGGRETQATQRVVVQLWCLGSRPQMVWVPPWLERISWCQCSDSFGTQEPAGAVYCGLCYWDLTWLSYIFLFCRSYTQCCTICYPLCVFIILAACVMACAGLIWMQIALKEDLDSLKEQLRTSTFALRILHKTLSVRQILCDSFNKYFTFSSLLLFDLQVCLWHKMKASPWNYTVMTTTAMYCLSSCKHLWL